MSQTTGRTTRVIGWYHSHPHHTVLPSHIDVRTQGTYQLLDSEKVGRFQVIAFQSLDRKHKVGATHSNSSVIDVQSSWSTSDNKLSSSESVWEVNAITDTGDSSASKSARGAGKNSSQTELGEFFDQADAGRGKGKSWSHPPTSYGGSSSQQTFVDVDPLDMTASMKEAMHRSTMDMSDAEFVRKELPLEVVPSSILVNLESPLGFYLDVQEVLFEEEKAAFNQAILQSTRDNKIHPLSFIHHTSTYNASLCKLMEYCLNPAIESLQCQLRENETRLALLAEEALSLESIITQGSQSSGSQGSLASGNPSSGSPARLSSRSFPAKSPSLQRNPSASPDASPSSRSGGSSRSKRGQ